MKIYLQCIVEEGRIDVAYNHVQLLASYRWQLGPRKGLPTTQKRIKFKLVHDYRICDRDRMEHIDSKVLIKIDTTQARRNTFLTLRLILLCPSAHEILCRRCVCDGIDRESIDHGPTTFARGVFIIWYS
jgi:hypothetical protein